MNGGGLRLRQYGYRMSKAALNSAGATLARDLRADDIHVAIIHPGAVRPPPTCCVCRQICYSALGTPLKHLVATWLSVPAKRCGCRNPAAVKTRRQFRRRRPRTPQ